MTSSPRIDEQTITVGETTGSVSAIRMTPADPKALYVLAHGAGAGMRHPFMETMATALADRGIATLRYQFPYIEKGKKRPDVPNVLQATVRAAVRSGREWLDDLPTIAGGKSLGGRMTSQAQAKTPLEGVDGLVFLGFPLHAPGRNDASRADHLGDIDVPMLFLQGTRDALADLSLLTPVCDRLGRRATLHVVDGGDHSFKVPKRSGRSMDEVFRELIDAIDAWCDAAL